MSFCSTNRPQQTHLRLSSTLATSPVGTNIRALNDTEVCPLGYTVKTTFGYEEFVTQRLGVIFLLSYFLCNLQMGPIS
jgi:hypothetical protein